MNTIHPTICKLNKSLVFGLDYIYKKRKFQMTEVGFERVRQFLEDDYHHKIDLLDVDLVSADAEIIEINAYWRRPRDDCISSM